MYRVDFREFHSESGTVNVWTAAVYHDAATAEWHRDVLTQQVQFPEVGLWDVVIRETNEEECRRRGDLPEKQEADVPTRRLEVPEL